MKENNRLPVRNVHLLALCAIVTLIIIGLSGMASAAPSITNWSSTGGNPTYKDNPQDLIYKVQQGDTITFTAASNLSCDHVWKVLKGSEELTTHTEHNTKTSSFTWTVPSEKNNWDITVFLLPHSVGPRPRLTWTLTTSALNIVNPGESIQNAIDSLPPEGGIVELKEGMWNINNAAAPIWIKKSNVTLRGQGKDKTIINATEKLNKWKALVRIFNGTESEWEDHINALWTGNYPNLEDCNISNVRIEDIHFHGACIEVDYLWGNTGVEMGRNRDCAFANLLIDNIGPAIQFHGSWYMLVEDCVLKENSICSDSTWFHSIWRNNILGYTYHTHNLNLNGGCHHNQFIGNIFGPAYASNSHGIIFYMWSNHCVVENNIFRGFGTDAGTAIGSTNSYDLLIKNNVFYDNHIAFTLPYHLEGEAGTITIKNNIFMNNDVGVQSNVTGATFILSHNDFYNNGVNYDGITAGAGDIYVDPLFANAANVDFHLKSQYGRWNGTDWVNDNETSPCIDAGDPNSSYSNETYPHGQRINIGAYGNTSEASKSPYHRIYLSVPMTIYSNGEYSYPEPPITYKDNQTVNVTFNVTDTTNLTINSYTSSQISFTATNTTTDQKMNITVYNGTFRVINGKKYEIKKDGVVQQTKTASNNKVVFTDIPVGSDYVITESSDNGYTVTLAQGYNMIGWTSTTPANSSNLCNEVPNCTYVYKKNPDGSWTTKHCGYPGGEFTVSRGFGFLAYVTEACEWTRDSTTFKYQRDITITEQSGSNLTDYQVPIELDNTNFDFTHTKPNGEDIRFKDKNENLLSYFIEEWDATNESAKVWVKVPSIPANSSTMIYMYYGNSEAESASDSEATFGLFDDFNSVSGHTTFTEGYWSSSDAKPEPFPTLCYDSLYNYSYILLLSNRQTYFVFKLDQEGNTLDYTDTGISPASDSEHGNANIFTDSQGFVYWIRGAHSAPGMRVYKSMSPASILFQLMHEFDESLTYPHPIINEDDEILLFVRETFSLDPLDEDLSYFKSTDGGSTWSGTRLTAYSGECVYFSEPFFDQNGKLHVAFTPNDPKGSMKGVCYCYSPDFGVTWYNANGTALSVPIGDDEFDWVIQEDGAASIWNGITLYDGKPVVLLHKGRDTGTRTLSVGIWNGSSWDIHNITTMDDSKWSGESGYICNINGVLYVYAQLDIGGTYELKKYKSEDGGVTWVEDEYITKDLEYDAFKFKESTNLINESAKNGAIESVFGYGTDGNVRVLLYPQMKYLEIPQYELNSNKWNALETDPDCIQEIKGGKLWLEVPEVPEETWKWSCITSKKLLDTNSIIIETQIRELDTDVYDVFPAISPDNSTAINDNVENWLAIKGRSVTGGADFLEERVEGSSTTLYDFASYISPDKWHTAKLIRMGNQVRAILDDKDSGWLTTSVNFTDAYIRLDIWMNKNRTVCFNWIRARKYTDPEPSVSIGSEKTV